MLYTWNDPQVKQKGGHETVQILSCFFNQLVLSKDHIFHFEKALESILGINCYIWKSRDFELNSSLLGYKVDAENI